MSGKNILPELCFIVFVACLILSLFMFYSILIRKNFMEKTKLQKLISVPALIITVVYIWAMIDEIQYHILKICEFMDSFNFGLYFLVSVAAIIFSCFMLHSIFGRKDFREKSTLQKVALIPALAISLIFIMQMTLGGDVSPNLSAEEMARYFAEYLCKGKTEYKKNRVLAPEYHEDFVSEWAPRRKEFSGIYTESDDFFMIEYHYIDRNILSPEKCTVVLRTSKILSLGKTAEEIEAVDIDFEIRLQKVSIPSRFLGKYRRWRISGFSYTKSEPSSLKQLFDKLK